MRCNVPCCSFKFSARSSSCDKSESTSHEMITAPGKKTHTTPSDACTHVYFNYSCAFRKCLMQKHQQKRRNNKQETIHTYIQRNP